MWKLVILLLLVQGQISAAGSLVSLAEFDYSIKLGKAYQKPRLLVDAPACQLERKLAEALARAHQGLRIFHFGVRVLHCAPSQIQLEVLNESGNAVLPTAKEGTRAWRQWNDAAALSRLHRVPCKGFCYRLAP